MARYSRPSTSITRGDGPSVTQNTFPPNRRRTRSSAATDAARAVLPNPADPGRAVVMTTGANLSGSTSAPTRSSYSTGLGTSGPGSGGGGHRAGSGSRPAGGAESRYDPAYSPANRAGVTPR